MNNEYFYEVWKLGYDSEWNVTDDEEFVGRFDRYYDARDCFVKLCENDAIDSCANTSFIVEKCMEDTDGNVFCVDVIDEESVSNAKAKEDIAPLERTW